MIPSRSRRSVSPPKRSTTRKKEDNMGCLDIPNETVFTLELTPVKVGPDATDEVAYELKRLGVKHPSIITDRGGMKLGHLDHVPSRLQEPSLTADICDRL